MTSPRAGLLVAVAVHAGFQATVTTLVYPALARTPPAQWEQAHQAHSRAITPLVAAVYGGLAAAGARALRGRPDGRTAAALAATAGAVLVTAAVAAPAHRRLGAGHDPAVLRRLLRADRVRAVAALAALAAAARPAR